MNGLTDEEVVKSRNKHGSNGINIEKNNSFIRLLIDSLGDPIIKILLVALGIKIVFLFKDFDWYETIGILIAIFVASFISSISEYGSEKAFIKMQKEASKTKCIIKRNGQEKELSIDEVVVGDIIKLSQGDKIPADGYLIEGDITVDESSLNGEKREIYKEEKNKYSNNILEKNKVYRGTVVYSKIAFMKVTSVGSDTVYGKIASELMEKEEDSPLKIRLRELAQVISKIGYIASILVSISYLFSVIVLKNNFNFILIKETITNYNLMFDYIIYSLTLSVTIIVVAVPEGLPMMITLVLSSNMKRMLKDNVLVRKLVGIETAGNINILFTDKTGTITKGNLEVIGIMDGLGNNYSNKDELLRYPLYKTLIEKNILYNSDSIYDNKTKDTIGGNITDQALVKYISKEKSNNIRIINKYPFDSKLKYSKTIIDDGKIIELIKGAYEKVLVNCSYYYDNYGKVKRLLNKKELENKIKFYSSKGIRVLTLAEKSFGDKELILVGIVLIKDEIRKEAIEGISLVNEAHIQTVMITGDNHDTAVAIAKEVGILSNDDDVVISSNELQNMSDTEVKKLIPKLRVVSRSLPQDKSRLIRLSQELGLVVGMTGDGVNDAPALKKADVGFSMGSGTEVSKEASDIVILDDNFMSISKAILYGRTIFKSIRKFIIVQLTINVCAISLSIICPFIGIDTPVTVIQMLWVNMVMDTLAGLAFAYEAPSLEYMKEYPKKKREPIINRYMISEILFTGIYSALICILFLKLPIVYHLFRKSNNNVYLMTAFFGLFIFIDIFNSFNARTSRLDIFANISKNKVFIFIMLFITLVQILLIYFGGHLFRTAGLNIKEFIIMLLIASTVIPIEWIRKILYRKKFSYESV